MSIDNDDPDDRFEQVLQGMRAAEMPELRPQVRLRVLADFRAVSARRGLDRRVHERLTQKPPLAIAAGFAVAFGLGAALLSSAQTPIAIEQVYADYMSLKPFGS
jgi:hypothetical protein